MDKEDERFLASGPGLWPRPPKDTRNLFSKIRWKVYNLAFQVFGNTRLWPRLGFAIWK